MQTELLAPKTNKIFLDEYISFEVIGLEGDIS